MVRAVWSEHCIVLQSIVQETVEVFARLLAENGHGEGRGNVLRVSIIPCREAH